MKKKVLIVEDDYLISYLMESYISQCDSCQLIGTADNGDDAIEIAKKEKPDFILMDIRINGDIDGIETAIRINQTDNIQIIYTSGNNDPTTLERATKTNMLDFLVKPVDKQKLLDILSKIDDSVLN